MATTDPRAWLAEAQERYAESRKDASHVVMFDNMDAALADNPAMAAALTAVLDVLDQDAWDQHTDEVGIVTVVNAEDILTAITDSLGGDRG